MSGRIVSVSPGDQSYLQVAQLLLQSLGEELLVEPGGWGLVGHEWLPEAGTSPPVVAGCRLVGKGTSRLMVA